MLKRPIKILLVGSLTWSNTIFTQIHHQSLAKATLIPSGKKALNVTETELFDLVFVTYQLNDMNAEDFCCQLRVQKGYRKTKIILFDAESNCSSIKNVMHQGATDVVTFIAITELIDYVNRQIEDTSHTIAGRVLLVEDSINQQALIQGFLAKMGLDIDVFESAETALEHIRHADTEYDLVITEVMLNGQLSGLSLVREMRQGLAGQAETSILALSSFDEKSRQIALLHLGVNDYLIKPIICEELQARVRNIIQRRQMLSVLREQQKMMEHMALIDPVTKIYNRTAFNDIGPTQFEAAIRNNTPLCLVIADIDYFKRVNDQYGHLKGDAILKEMAACLKNYVRRGDLVFRWGGEEFVLLLACSAKKGAMLTEKIRYKIEHTLFANIVITASFGISWTEPGRESQLSILFQQADQALLEAKNTGRNKVSAFSPDTFVPTIY